MRRSIKALGVACILLPVVSTLTQAFKKETISCDTSQSVSGNVLNDTAVTLEDFGVRGDGTDETANISKALEYAQKHKRAVHLLNKTYIFSPSFIVDITGIPAFTGKGIFDLSGIGPNAGNKSMKAVFQISGKKKLLQSDIQNLRKGQKIVVVKPDLSLKAGDILFLTSSEALPNAKRPYYCKGQRLVVHTYDETSGHLVVDDSLFYDIDRACLWLNSERPSFSVDKCISFITSPMNFITCFRIYYATAHISGYYKNFALTAIMYKSSGGTVKNMQAELPVTANNGYSHCIQVADMSEVLISDCQLSGGRHVISGTAGGLWEKEESGGVGHAGYPSTLTVDGGIYRGTSGVVDITPDIGTVDAHGVIEKMTIKNCTIYGGINLGANYMSISNVTIYPDNKNAFNVGSDVVPGSSWGHYEISKVTIIAGDSDTNPFFSSKADINEIKIEEMTVQDLAENTWFMDFNYNSPKYVFMNKITGSTLKRNPLIKSLKRTQFVITNSDFTTDSIKWR